MTSHAPRWSIESALADAVQDRLHAVVDPCTAASVSAMSIVEFGLVRDVTLLDGVLTVHLRLTVPGCSMVAYIAREVVERLRDLPGVREARVQPDEGLDWDESLIDPRAAAVRRQRVALLGLPTLPRVDEQSAPVS